MKIPQGKPKYSKHSSGQARVRLGGQVHYLGEYGSKDSTVEYYRLLAEFNAAGGVVISDAAKGNLTVTEVFSAYLPWAKKNYGEDATEFTKVKRIIKQVRKFYGDFEAAAFGYVQFEAIRSGFVADGLARNYVNATMDRLVRIFKWSASRGMIPPAVPQALAMIERLKKGRTAAPDHAKILPVDAAVVEATLPHLTDVVRDMVRLQAVLGCRPGEVCKISPGMVDRSGDVWEITLVEHKTAHHGKNRVLYVGSRGQAILEPYLLRMPDACCFSPIESEQQRRDAVHATRTTPLSCGNKPGSNRKRKPSVRPGGEYTTASYGKAIHRACDKAFPAPTPLGRLEGESDQARLSRLGPEQKKRLKAWQRDHQWNLNQLRHAYATEAWKTEDPEAVQIMLGHSNLNTTLIYAERDRQKAIDVARRVG